jgi:hypothetical protein
MQQRMNAELLTILAVCLLALSLPQHASAALPGTPSCTQARGTSETNAAPGVLAGQFVDCAEQLFGVMGQLLRIKLVIEQKEALAPFVSVYDRATASAVANIRTEILPGATQAQLINFEDMIRQTVILDEVAALQQVLQTPGDFVLCDRDGNGIVDRTDINTIFAERGRVGPTKKTRVKRIIKSVKDLITLWRGENRDIPEPGTIKDGKEERPGPENPAFDPVDEVINMINGDHRTTVNDARSCVLLCQKPACAP